MLILELVFSSSSLSALWSKAMALFGGQREQFRVIADDDDSVTLESITSPQATVQLHRAL
jgi:hypothetical protein